jgi:hypothetical protein
MRTRISGGICLSLSWSLFLVLQAGTISAEGNYPWLTRGPETVGRDSIVARIAPPPGFERINAAANSFGEWLRGLPLKPAGTPVLLYNGRLKANQEAHWAVVDLDVGSADLQQCADAVIRLRAEYLFSRERFAQIHFNYTSGARIEYVKWAEGYRPTVAGKKVAWRKDASVDRSYHCFKDYLLNLFSYAGSLSLSRELVARPDLRSMEIGDVFIQGGSPGHAILICDLAVDPRTGEKVFLIGQSYMPAQEFHLLRNPADRQLSPWYRLDFEGDLRTPEWVFQPGDLKRWP